MTELEKMLDLEAKKFTWGTPLARHEIGDFQIVEYVDDKEFVNRQSELGRIYFHAYVGGKDTCQSATTLEGALIIAIAYKYDGPNHGAMYAARVLGIEGAL